MSRSLSGQGFSTTSSQPPPRQEYGRRSFWPPALTPAAYRLGWPANTDVYEVDQPGVIAFKTADARMTWAPRQRRTARPSPSICATTGRPLCVTAGFDPAQPTAWIAEGLLPYLPPDAQDRLFDHITALSAPGSRLATEHMDMTNLPDDWADESDDRWRRRGLRHQSERPLLSGRAQEARDYLSSHGWHGDHLSTRTRTTDNGFELPDDEFVRIIGDSGYLTATL